MDSSSWAARAYADGPGSVKLRPNNNKLREAVVAGSIHETTIAPGEELEALLRERRQHLYWRRFDPVLESRFRTSLRRQRRWPRVILFSLIALSFALAALFEQQVFFVKPADIPTVRVVQYALVTPLALLAALAAYLDAPRLLSQAAQTSAVVATLFGLLVFRHLALTSGMHFPSQLTGIALVAVAEFAAFRWRRMCVAAAGFTAAAIAQEYLWRRPDSAPEVQTYTLLLLMLIGMVAAYLNEAIHRQSWLDRRYASLLSRTDLLTGLSSRNDFLRLLPRIIGQAGREQKFIAACLLDIDHFKTINDERGHAVGDGVLREVGTLMLRSVARRPWDLKMRYGGEEFLLIWYDAAPAALPGLVEALLESIRRHPFPGGEGQAPLAVTASAGVTWLVPGSGTRPEAILSHADTLLYRAKEEGRDRALLAPYQDN
jgi:diguanylate cyclase (GGDEF)-like protein